MSTVLGNGYRQQRDTSRTIARCRVNPPSLSTRCSDVPGASWKLGQYKTRAIARTVHEEVAMVVVAEDCREKTPRSTYSVGDPRPWWYIAMLPVGLYTKVLTTAKLPVVDPQSIERGFVGVGQVCDRTGAAVRVLEYLVLRVVASQTSPLYRRTCRLSDISLLACPPGCPEDTKRRPLYRCPHPQRTAVAAFLQ